MLDLKFSFSALHSVFKLEHFKLILLEINSECLRSNLLGDSTIKRHVILVPSNGEEDVREAGELNLIVNLSGLAGNGTFSLNQKFNERSLVEKVDSAFGAGLAPRAIYVFADCMTSIGGGQFRNSPITGLFEDHLIHELMPILENEWPISKLSQNRLVTGGSSGGYGALHLASLYPQVFGQVAATAPDCFFEASLYGDLIAAIADIELNGGIIGAIRAIQSQVFKNNKNNFKMTNAVAMICAYESEAKSLSQIKYPLHLNTAKRDEALWASVLNCDPLHFLPQRIDRVHELKGIYLDVGKWDQYFLQYGSRQIHHLLEHHGVTHTYEEFAGTHFDIGDRRKNIWKWLISCQKWPALETSKGA